MSILQLVERIIHAHYRNDGIRQYSFHNLVLMIFFTLIFISHLYAQSDEDTLQLLPGEDSLLTLIKTSDDDSLTMDWYNKLRRLTIYQDPERSLKYAEQYGIYADQIGNQKRGAIARFYQGNSYMALGNYQKAMEKYLYADSVFTAMKDTALISAATNSIGAVYEKTGRDSLAIGYFERMLEIAQAKNDVRRIVIGSNNISNVYYRAGQYSKSEEVLNRLLKMPEENIPEDQLIHLKLNYANTLLKLRRFFEAEEIYRGVLNSSVQLDNYSGFIARKGLGTLLLQTKRFFDARRELSKAWILANEYQFRQEYPEILELLSAAYEKTGQYELAYKTFFQFSQLKDSLMNEDKDRNLIDALTKYETEKKEQEIKLLSAQNQIKDLRIRQSNQLKVLMVISIVALAVLAFLGFRLQHIRSRANAQLREKNKIIERSLEEKNILMREIHHRVKNNLQVISSLLKLQSNFISDATALNALADGRNRVQSMALLHQKLYREEDMLGVDMRTYFTDLINGLFDAYDVSENNVGLKLDINDISLDVDTVIPLGLIANELISNALKHAFSDVEDPVLKVSLSEKDNTLILRVKDNGKGLADDDLMKNDGSFGQRLIKSLSQKLDASVNYRSNGGLEASVIISEYEKTQQV